MQNFVNLRTSARTLVGEAIDDKSMHMTDTRDINRVRSLGSFHQLVYYIQADSRTEHVLKEKL